jgi:hypothetical protein
MTGPGGDADFLGLNTDPEEVFLYPIRAFGG